MSFRTLLLACSVITAVASGPAMSAPAAAPSVQSPPAVTVVSAVRGEITERTTVSGSLAARDEILVGPQVDGLTIVEIMAEEGDHVTRGQVLATLDRDTLDASVMQAAAQVARADASEVQARAQIGQAGANIAQTAAALARSVKLEATGVASRETLDQRQASARIAVAQGELAEGALASAAGDKLVAQAQLRDAQVRLARAYVRAPRAGTVIRRTARLGAISSMSAGSLFSIAGGGEVELEASVPQAALSRIRPDQEASVEIAGMDTVLHGVVRLVSPEVALATRLGKVRVSLPPDAAVPVGGFAKARITLARASGVIVPLSAVLSRPGGSEVQVVRDGVVETRRVRVGLRDSKSAMIVDGVSEGDEVISVSGAFVRAGDRVSVVRSALPR